jgi:glycosyltransferase involved in cell wall biosynthesis
MRIFVFSGSYLPTRTSGGTVRAIAGVVTHLGDEHEFHVVTPDHDVGSTVFPGVASGSWQSVGKATVYYAPPRDLVPHRLAALVSAVQPDAYYVNSLLSPQFGISPVMLRWIGAIPDRPLALAPRGELHPAALRIKRVKKQAFLQICRRLPAYANVQWQAGSPAETADIQREFGRDARIAVARDLTSLSTPASLSRPTKRQGELSLGCLARITPIKNLVRALEMLRHVEGQIQYDIYGPVLEPRYFEACRRVARGLPPNIRVRFAGEIPHDSAIETMALHHALFLPTLGESFGHAILESLLAGCMLVISDQTPWRGLGPRGVGWDLPLKDEGGFVRALQTCVDMDDSEFAAASRRARDYGAAALTSGEAVEENRAMFEQLRRSRPS